MKNLTKFQKYWIFYNIISDREALKADPSIEEYQSGNTNTKVFDMGEKAFEEMLAERRK